MPDLFQCIPATMPAYLQKVDSKCDKPCDFFLEALCAQANIFWREVKFNNMYTGNLFHDKKIFAL